LHPLKTNKGTCDGADRRGSIRERCLRRKGKEGGEGGEKTEVRERESNFPKKIIIILKFLINSLFKCHVAIVKPPTGDI
jgi:hypothetical protein